MNKVFHIHCFKGSTAENDAIVSEGFESFVMNFIGAPENGTAMVWCSSAPLSIYSPGNVYVIRRDEIPSIIPTNVDDTFDILAIWRED